MNEKEILWITKIDTQDVPFRKSAEENLPTYISVYKRVYGVYKRVMVGKSDSLKK
jgi:hypothetical protein